MIKVLVRLDFFYDDEDAIDHFILMIKSLSIYYSQAHQVQH